MASVPPLVGLRESWDAWTERDAAVGVARCGCTKVGGGVEDEERGRFVYE